MSQSKRQKTHQQYNTYLTAWLQYCQQNDISPTQAATPHGLAFLEHLRMSRNLGYSAMNTARSALSSILQTSGEQPFGQDQFVKLYMRGLFNINPPVPRYKDTWDPSVVLNLLRQWSPVGDIDLKTLTLKVVILILLVSGQRIQTLSYLDVTYMKSSHSSYSFVLDCLLKQTRPGYSNPTVKLVAYAPDRRLCVHRYLTEYLKRTAPLRNNESALLLCYQKPHKKASKDTIARWVRSVLNTAGIDTNKYGPHSIRAASTSAAKRGGATVQAILDTAGWASTNVFAKYYDKVVHVQGNTPFHVAVLGK